MYSLQKIFDLINKTGDRCIVVSSNDESAYAVMSIQEYERLALGKSEVSSLTEDELLDKINRDIAVWKSKQEQERQDREWDEDIKRNNFRFDGEFGDNFANPSQNYQKPGSLDENFDDLADEEEEPYYFEKI